MNTLANEIISFRAPHALKEKLEKLADITKRSKTDLLLFWVEDGIATEEWQLQEIELGVQEANAGKFASKEEVDRVLKKWL
jgi:RHH-type rel operon transcriptional repressor/antitoxin RelB